MPDAWRTIHHPVIKDTMTFVRTSEETGGELTDLELELAPGGGNPLHRHGSYSERFEVLEGTLGVQIENEKHVLEAGESVVVPARVAHRFYNPTERYTRFSVELRPGGTRVENGFRILYGLAVDGKVGANGIPRSPKLLAVVLMMTDMSAVGPLRLMAPLLRWLAGRAAVDGTERALLERYCTPPARVPG